MSNGPIVLAMSLLSANSCAATECADYRHLVFELVQGMTIEETRVPALGGLRDVKPFPISYALRRSSYQVIVRSYERDYGPTATLSVEAGAPMTLRVTDVPMSSAGSSCVVMVEQSGGVKFSWLGKAGYGTNPSIAVAVIDATGSQIAIEELPFKVVTNGRYCVRDAL